MVAALFQHFDERVRGGIEEFLAGLAEALPVFVPRSSRRASVSRVLRYFGPSFSRQAPGSIILSRMSEVAGEAPPSREVRISPSAARVLGLRAPATAYIENRRPIRIGRIIS
jgi:hypothetical protein